MELARSELVGPAGLGDLAHLRHGCDERLQVRLLVVTQRGGNADRGTVLAGKHQRFDPLLPDRVRHRLHLCLGRAELHQDDHPNLRIPAKLNWVPVTPTRQEFMYFSTPEKALFYVLVYLSLGCLFWQLWQRVKV